MIINVGTTPPLWLCQTCGWSENLELITIDEKISRGATATTHFRDVPCPDGHHDWEFTGWTWTFPIPAGAYRAGW